MTSISPQVSDPLRGDIENTVGVAQVDKVNGHGTVGMTRMVEKHPAIQVGQLTSCNFPYILQITWDQS